jgi:aryl-alcohol dehydrogenase-like predicted oxidoreductase
VSRDEGPEVDLRQHVTFGRTGLMVSRLGLASGYGVPTAAIERAFHEHGVNYFYLSLLRRGKMLAALRNLLPRHRDELVIALPKPVKQGYFLRAFVERWLRRLRLDQIELLILQGVDRPPTELLLERARALRDEGKVRFISASGHNRPLIGRVAGGEYASTLDVIQLRYNAAHRGAEQDIFPHLPDSREQRPGIVGFTATCWRQLLKSKNMPPGEQPLSGADCCRFVLTRPQIDVCITGPSTAARMDDNLRALAAGPLSDEELVRARRIGDHVYGR